MFSAVDVLASMRICHRDIKPQNLLVNLTSDVL
jgi:serine/threonine protein kinase